LEKKEKKKKKHNFNFLESEKPNAFIINFLFFWKLILLLNEQGEAGDLTTGAV
jgi:hypothetical protein